MVMWALWAQRMRAAQSLTAISRLPIFGLAYTNIALFVAGSLRLITSTDFNDRMKR